MKQKINISKYIPNGHKNAVTRTALTLRTGLGDRDNRLEIEEIKEPEELVINLSDGMGYFRPLPCEADLVRRYRDQEKSRLRSIDRKVKLADKWLERYGAGGEG